MMFTFLDIIQNKNCSFIYSNIYFFSIRNGTKITFLYILKFTFLDMIHSFIQYSVWRQVQRLFQNGSST
jgi:hypothetical protein